MILRSTFTVLAYVSSQNMDASLLPRLLAYSTMLTLHCNFAPPLLSADTRTGSSRIVFHTLLWVTNSSRTPMPPSKRAERTDGHTDGQTDGWMIPAEFTYLSSTQTAHYIKVLN
jgi:hypothetical protein